VKWTPYLLQRGEGADAARTLRERILSVLPLWLEAYTQRARYRFYPAAGNGLCDCLRALSARLGRPEAGLRPGDQPSSRAAFI